MKKIIGIGGEPATGKTTLMLSLMELTDDWKKTEPVKLVNSLYSEELNLYILGKYNQEDVENNYAQGTDKLSMAVQPNAENFISETTSNVIFEGDRLFNGKYMDYISTLPDCKFSFLILKASEEVKKKRHIDRNDSQNEKFLRGRATKYENIIGNLFLSEYIKIMQNNDKNQQNSVINYVKTFLEIP